MVVKRVKKRIFGNNVGFKVKGDPNTWTEQDLDHMCRVLIRTSRKSPIKMITFHGVKHTAPLSSTGHWWKKSPSKNWSDHTPRGKYMDFEVEFETKCPKVGRKLCMDDIKMMLIMEVL